MAVVANEWQRRTEAEYQSAAIAQHVTLWMIQVGAPPDLIGDGLHVVRDELAHSELAAGVAAAAGNPGPPLIDPARLTLPSPAGPLLSLAHALVRSFCVGETVAVPLFRMLRSRATVPQCRHVLDVVLGDEARHRQFGWDGLDWLLSSHEHQVAPTIRHLLPVLLDEVRQMYGGSEAEAPVALAPEMEAWGLAPASDYAATVIRAVADDVLPRLDVRGLRPPG